MKRRVNGAHGWAALAGFVIAWDMLAPETLSDAFGRTPRAWTVLASGIVLGHLFDLLPSRVDPISRLGALLCRARPR